MEKYLRKVIQNEIMSEEEKIIVGYGLQSLIDNVISICIVMIVAFICGNVIEGIMFYFFSLPLRRNVGGYHADTRMRCFLISTIILVGIWRFCDFVYDLKSYFIILFLSDAIILKLAPVENLNKDLQSEEKIIYKRRIFIFVLIENFIFISWAILGNNVIIKSIFMSLLMVAILTVLGKLKICSKNVVRGNISR